MYVCDIYIEDDNMSFQRKRNIYGWCPRQFNFEIAFNKHAFQMSNQISDLAQNMLLEKIITTAQNGIRASVTSFILRQCYVIYFVQKTGQLILEKLS